MLKLQESISWDFFISSAFLRAGHTFAQTPQPVQSFSEICKLNTQSFIPRALEYLNPSGQDEILSFFVITLLIAECGQAREDLRIKW